MIEGILIVLFIGFIGFGFYLAFYAGNMCGWQQGYLQGIKDKLKDEDDGK